MQHQIPQMGFGAARIDACAYSTYFAISVPGTMTYRSQLNKDFSYDYLLKVLICGDSYVGKTSVLTRFVSNKFRVTHIRTLGKSRTYFRL